MNTFTFESSFVSSFDFFAKEGNDLKFCFLSVVVVVVVVVIAVRSGLSRLFFCSSFAVGRSSSSSDDDDDDDGNIPLQRERERKYFLRSVGVRKKHSFRALKM